MWFIRLKWAQVCVCVCVIKGKIGIEDVEDVETTSEWSDFKCFEYWNHWSLKIKTLLDNNDCIAPFLYFFKRMLSLLKVV